MRSRQQQGEAVCERAVSGRESGQRRARVARGGPVRWAMSTQALGFNIATNKSSGEANTPQPSASSLIDASIETASTTKSLYTPLVPRQPAAPPPQLESTWLVDSALFFVMGMSGWWTVNAIVWAETPIFVAETAEKQAIGNWLSVACQVGNIFPFVYKGKFSKKRQQEILAWSILVCQAIAIATGVMTAVAWKWEVSLFGQQRSVALILCTVVAGGVGTLSNVTYWALATRYPGTHCTKAMGLGMTFSGFASAWAAMAQNAGTSPRFTAEIFMLGVAAVQGMFMIAFVFILQRDLPSAEEDCEAPPPAPKRKPLEKEPVTPRFGMTGRSASRVGLGSSLNLNSSDNALEEAPYGAKSTQKPEPPVVPVLAQRMVLAVMFSVYALTYSLGSLGPYMVQHYSPTENATISQGCASCDRGDLLRYINLASQTGDVAGSGLAALLTWVPGAVALSVLTMIVLGISGLFIAASVPAISAQAPTMFPGYSAYMYPLAFFVYYVTRRYLVTVLYVRVKLDMARKDSESFSSNMGLAGQIGAMLANLGLFFVINVFQWIPAAPN